MSGHLAIIQNGHRAFWYVIFYVFMQVYQKSSNEAYFRSFEVKKLE